MFENRLDAASKLAEKLSRYKNTDAVVLAIPRGGVTIGKKIADELNIPLEIILSKKIGHPRNPEFAIGSVSELGMVVNDDLMNISTDYIQNEAARLQLQLKERYKLFMGDRKPSDLKNKIVILVDDGIATGNTILATINMIKKKFPKKLVVAVPVAPPDTARKINKEVDELICLLTPGDFYAVGQFYEDFSQVTDEEVIKMLGTDLKSEKRNLAF
ncbi:MAG: phosphoribosyltransferase [Bacteroidetes bacterium RIFCSPLOWO2_12_FULL_35_15]|nr:MAG: phosphoribosyltransferase [Bacteroidetes bacterium RIFCSPLOWO2_12_FULL_35_15]